MVKYRYTLTLDGGLYWLGNISSEISLQMFGCKIIFPVAVLISSKKNHWNVFRAEGKILNEPMVTKFYIISTGHNNLA